MNAPMRRFVKYLSMAMMLSACVDHFESDDNKSIYFPTVSDMHLYLHVGDDYMVEPSGFPAEYENIWESIDKNVATVEWNGLIKAKGLGDTEVSCVSSYPKQDLSFIIYVHVMSDDVYTFRSAYLKMIPVKGGSFTMGKEGYALNPARDVTVNDFMLSEIEVTEALYKEIVYNSPLYSEKGAEYKMYPVAGTYYDLCFVFLQALCERTGKSFRIPSEAEWEYAARAGEETIYSGGDNLDELGWYKYSPGTEYHPFSERSFTIHRPAKQFKPNAWGFYDMSGGAAEWVSDVVGETDATSDDLDPDDLQYQKDLLVSPGAYIAKGGSAYSPASCCTVWSRESYFSFRGNEEFGMRGPFGIRVAL